MINVWWVGVGQYFVLISSSNRIFRQEVMATRIYTYSRLLLKAEAQVEMIHRTLC